MSWIKPDRAPPTSPANYGQLRPLPLCRTESLHGDEQHKADSQHDDDAENAPVLRPEDADEQREQHGRQEAHRAAGRGVEAEHLALTAGGSDPREEGAARRLRRTDEEAQDEAADPERT